MSKIKRSLTKTMTYRIANMFVSFGVFTAITGSLQVGGMLMAADATLSSLLYYVHERLWDRVGWGTK